jgi:hypothetical protein
VLKVVMVMEAEMVVMEVEVVVVMVVVPFPRCILSSQLRLRPHWLRLRWRIFAGTASLCPSSSVRPKSGKKSSRRMQRQRRLP